MADGARLTLPQGLLIALAAVVVFGGALWLAYRSQRKGAQLFEAFGKTRGWAYSRTDTQGLAANMQALIPSERYTFDNILISEEPGRKVILFECGYRRADLQKVNSFGTGCLVEAPAFAKVKGPVEVVGRTWADAALLGGKAPLGRPEFDGAFIVLAGEPGLATSVVGPELQNLLLAHAAAPLFNPVRLVIGPSGAVVLTGYPADPERWDDLVNLAKRVEETFRGVPS
jgi:hypothetical protein